MEVLTTYTFKIKVAEGREFTFNVPAKSQEEAKNILLKELQQVVVQLNTIHLG